MAAIADAMRARGWRFEAVTKATTHYVGSSAAEDLHDNMAVRNAYYRRPGPASTGLSLAAFPFSQSKIAVDVPGVIESCARAKSTLPLFLLGTPEIHRY